MAKKKPPTKGMHKMPFGGHMMSDKDMTGMMKPPKKSKGKRKG